jgi:predicted nucleic-acid-binding Zn-ribbon protein
MKESNITARWIAAGELLATDPSQQVPCPRCENDILVVKDIGVGGIKFERLMSCPSCGAHNFLLMKKTH